MLLLLLPLLPKPEKLPFCGAASRGAAPGGPPNVAGGVLGALLAGAACALPSDEVEVASKAGLTLGLALPLFVVVVGGLVGVGAGGGAAFG